MSNKIPSMKEITEGLTRLKIPKDYLNKIHFFNPTACTYATDGIYWSLKAYTENKIVLHGCQKEYTIKRPEKSFRSNREWFKYEEY
jgi:hypothetical protein